MFCLFFVLIQGFLIKVVCRRVRSGMSLSRRHHKAVTCDLRTSVRTAFIIYTSGGWAFLILTGLPPGLCSAACLRATRQGRAEHFHGTSSLRPNLFLYRNVSVLNLTLIFKGVDQG